MQLLHYYPQVRALFKRPIVHCLALMVLTFVVYAATFSFEFVNFDDDFHITNNSALANGVTLNSFINAFTDLPQGYWRPVTMVSFTLDAAFFGLDPRIYHTENALIHSINVMLLYVMLSRLTGAHWKALAVAALFAIHPTNVETVAWVSERKGLLCAFFYFLCLISYTNYVRKNEAKWMILSVLLFALSLMAKPSLLATPFVLLLLDYFPLQRMTIPSCNNRTSLNQSNLLTLISEKYPMFVVSIAFGLLTLGAERHFGDVDTHNFDWRFLMQGVSVNSINYLQHMVYPVGLCAFYPIPPTWPIDRTIAFCILISTVLIGMRLHPPRWLYFGAGWFTLLMLPVINILQVGDKAYADRYTYVPGIGIWIIIVWWSDYIQARYRNKYAQIGVTLGCGIFLSLSCYQLQFWKSSKTLWTRALECTKDNYVALNNLAWEIASDKHATPADILKGMDYAVNACLITHGTNENIVDTLRFSATTVIMSNANSAHNVESVIQNAFKHFTPKDQFTRELIQRIRVDTIKHDRKPDSDL